MGAVSLGRDLKLDRHVALKVLPPEFAVQLMLRDRCVRAGARARARHNASRYQARQHHARTR